MVELDEELTQIATLKISGRNRNSWKISDANDFFHRSLESQLSSWSRDCHPSVQNKANPHQNPCGFENADLADLTKNACGFENADLVDLTKKRVRI